ncbi:MAG: hypothetical protein KAR06_11150 [Deltaproteobacteria bacterium]|nr:hypothetical protein [Deltaproteobacteria bacterium]
MSKGQPKHHSFIEVLVNSGIGMTIAFFTQKIVFPMFGIESSNSEHVAMVLIFTAVSMARSYTLRRVFNRFHLWYDARQEEVEEVEVPLTEWEL